MNLNREKVFSARLVLQKYEADDVEFIVDCCNTPKAVGQYLSAEKLTRKQFHERLANNYYWNKSNIAFTIRLKEGSKIGFIHAWQDPTQPQSVLFSVAITVPKYRKHGYGTEVQKILIQRLFSTCDYQKIEMYVDVNNIGQAKCLRSLGFSIDKACVYNDGGVSRSGSLYCLTKNKYLSIADYVYG
jgi:RimJ/RimL family protein N-acetyltransferase